MNFNIKKIMLSFVLLLVSFGHSFVSAQSVANYTSYPIFISQAVTPNVLIVLDNSGSMSWAAYWGNYDTNTKYYGYFGNDVWYKYDGDKFIEDPTQTAPTRFKGNMLNWASMRKVDVARKVLVGGKVFSRAGLGKKSLLGDRNDGWGGWKHNWDEITWSNSQDVVAPSGKKPYWFAPGYSGKMETWYWDAGSGVGVYTQYNIKVEVAHADTIGLIQRTVNSIRYGLGFFNTYQGANVAQEVANNNGPDMIQAIEDKSPNTWTPLAEAFYEMCLYFKQDTPKYYPGDFTISNTMDPYYDNDLSAAVPCAKSFIILITDGESTQDLDIPSEYRDYDNDGNEIGSPPPRVYGSDGSDYLDDLALWAHTSDLRSDLVGKQSITLYPVFAFGAGSQLLVEAAINGGFTDKNGNDIPDLTSEWDSDSDGVPDNYFEAEDGFALESALINAINDILKRATSGTAVSVLSTSSRGEGAVYQAYFLPTKPEGIEEVKWLGYLQAMWVDPFSNLREDTDRNLHLSYKEDRIVRFDFDEAENETKVKRYADNDGDGQMDDPQPAGFPQTIALEDVNSLWEAGKILAQTDAIHRNIFTFLDVDDTKDPVGAVGSDDVFDSTDEMILFTTANDTRLRPYLNAANDTEASNIISFIRGEDVSGYRNRNVTVGMGQEIWKLGDIVYSTPTPVGRPMSNYDLMYGDTSYLRYMQTHIERETVVYVGANDGMLHAFTAGRFKSSDDSSTTPEDHGWFEKVGNIDLGKELWAYIPYAALPHLKWLTSENYTHVYYVDLKPKVADMQIFGHLSGDGIHTDGWGTVLIGGMRLGGGEISLTDDFGRGNEVRTFRSEYFMLDITDPRDPRLIMRFEAPELGFTLSYPTVAKVGNDWFVIFGSGPENKYPPNYDGVSTQKARLYIVDMKTKTPYYKDFNQNNAFLGSPITVDVDFSPSQTPASTYNTEVGYIGQTYYSGSSWKGAMYRFIMKESSNPSTDWLFNEVMISGIDSPVFTPPAIGMDDDKNLWLYFGTGKMLSDSDKGDTGHELFIGAKEPCKDFSSSTNCSETLALTDLNDVTTAVVSNRGADVINAGLTTTGGWDELLSDVVGAAGYSGWRMTLPLAGEKVLAKPTVLGGLVLFTTYIPDTDVCSYGGSGYLYSVYYESGTAYKEPTIGLDLDGTTILRSVSLGKGVPASIGMHVGRNDAGKAFVQTSTGTIEEVETTPPSSVKSGITYWIQ